MDYTRSLEIKNEAERRLNEWLKNSSIEQMTHMGSKLTFNMSLGLLDGYPFKKHKWMEDDFNGFITLDEFDDPEYDFIIDELFEKTLESHPIKWPEQD